MLYVVWTQQRHAEMMLFFLLHRKSYSFGLASLLVPSTRRRTDACMHARMTIVIFIEPLLRTHARYGALALAAVQVLNLYLWSYVEILHERLLDAVHVRSPWRPWSTCGSSLFHALLFLLLPVSKQQVPFDIRSEISLLAYSRCNFISNLQSVESFLKASLFGARTDKPTDIQQEWHPDRPKLSGRG